MSDQPLGTWYWGELRSATADLAADAPFRHWERAWKVLAAWPEQEGGPSAKDALLYFTSELGRRDPALLEAVLDTSWLLDHYRKLPIPLGNLNALRTAGRGMTWPPLPWQGTTLRTSLTDGNQMIVMTAPSRLSLLATYHLLPFSRLRVLIGGVTEAEDEDSGGGPPEQNTPWEGLSSWRVIRLDGLEEWRAWEELCLKMAHHARAARLDREAEKAGEPAEEGGPLLAWGSEWWRRLRSEGRRLHPRLTYLNREPLINEDPHPTLGGEDED